MNEEKPRVYLYEDFRKFLKDSYAFLKKTKRSASFRLLASKAGFSSPNFLKLVMEGQRNLSIQGIGKVAKAFDLNRTESEFFECLVLFNQAQTTEEKTQYFGRMNKNRKFREIRQLETKQFEYFSRWYYPAVRELILMKDFRNDPVWIANALLPSITPREAEKALALLEELGLVKKDSSGRLEQTTRAVTSGAEVQSLAVKKFHMEMLKLAADSIDLASPKERDISGVMLNLPRSKIPEVKERIQQFRRDLIASVCTFDAPAEELYELNIQFFPLSRTKRG